MRFVLSAIALCATVACESPPAVSDGWTREQWPQCPPAGVELQDCVAPAAEIVGDVAENIERLDALCRSPCRTIEALMIVRTDISSLADVKPLTRFAHVQLGLNIGYNDKLTTLEGLERLQSVSKLEVSDNKELVSLKGLENLKELDELDLTSDPKLSNIDALSGLQRIWNVYFTSLDSLSTLAGLNGLKEVRYFFISYLPVLRDFEGLRSLETIAKQLNIDRNEQLQSLRGFDRLQPKGQVWFFMDENPKLPQCEAEAFAQRFSSRNDNTIRNNDLTATCEEM